MKKSSKKTLEKRGVLTAGRAISASGAQVHADKRQPPRGAQKQRLKRELQLETARNRGPFPFFRSEIFCELSLSVENRMDNLRGRLDKSKRMESRVKFEGVLVR